MITHRTEQLLQICELLLNNAFNNPAETFRIIAAGRRAALKKSRSIDSDINALIRELLTSVDHASAASIGELENQLTNANLPPLDVLQKGYLGGYKKTLRRGYIKNAKEYADILDIAESTLVDETERERLYTICADFLKSHCGGESAE